MYLCRKWMNMWENETHTSKRTLPRINIHVRYTVRRKSIRMQLYTHNIYIHMYIYTNILCLEVLYFENIVRSPSILFFSVVCGHGAIWQALRDISRWQDPNNGLHPNLILKNTLVWWTFCFSGNASIGRLEKPQQFTDETNFNEKLISGCDAASWSTTRMNKGVFKVLDNNVGDIRMPVPASSIFSLE